MRDITGIFLQCILIAVLILSPVLFDSRDIPVMALMEVLIFSSALLWFLRSVLSGKIIVTKTTLYLPMCAFILLLSAQLLLGKVTGGHLGTIYPYITKLYFFKVLSYMCLFFIIVNTLRSRREINRLIFTILAVGVMLAAYGIVQKVSGVTRIFGVREAEEVLLIYSSYTNCNYYSGYMNMVIFLALGAFFAYLAYLEKERGYRHFDVFEGWNLIFLFAIGIMTASLLHTLSMGGIIVFFASSVFFYVSYSEKMSQKKWILPAALLFTAAIAAVVSAWFLRGMLSRIFSELAAVLGNINTYGLRVPLWARAIGMMKEHPILGIGAGTFRYIFLKYQPHVNVSFAHPHSDYLGVLLESGVIGFSIFALGMSSFFKRYIRLLRLRHNSYSRAIGYGCLASAFSIFVFSFVDSNMRVMSNALLFSAILGIGFCAIHSRSDGAEDEDAIFKTKTFRVEGAVKRAALLGAGVASFLYLANAITSLAVADVYGILGSAEKRADHLETAIALEPSASEYHYDLAYLFSNGFSKKTMRNGGSAGKAIAELESAVRLNPAFSKYHRRLGFLYSCVGKGERAVEEFKKAQDTEPLNPFNYFLLAAHYFNEATAVRGVNPAGSGAMDRGVAEYKKALSLDPALTVYRHRDIIDDYGSVKRALKEYSL
ncbi:MAG: O-antigen ligase family protein [Candidatus Omnitrophota bacterium]